MQRMSQISTFLPSDKENESAVTKPLLWIYVVNYKTEVDFHLDMERGGLPCPRYFLTVRFRDQFFTHHCDLEIVCSLFYDKDLITFMK